MTTLTLAKHHGLGNDFLILLDLDGSTPIDAAVARALCDRHLGIGADGLIRATRAAGSGVRAPAPGSDRAEGGGGPAGDGGAGAISGVYTAEIAPGPDGGGGIGVRAADGVRPAALTFELRNADGSPAEVSGNGIRCLAHAALDAGVVEAGRPFVVATPAGPRTVTVRPGDGPTRAWASVEMGPARVIDGDSDRCNVGHGQLRVDMGNPHLVVLGPNPAMVAVGELGPELETRVPGGQNVEFVALGPGPDELTMRVWERGVGETLACGTGACAAVVALAQWGRVGRRVTVHQPGGDAVVELRPDREVVLAGPTVRIARCRAEVEAAVVAV
jgi:diaminopimelate epimerase